MSKNNNFNVDVLSVLDIEELKVTRIGTRGNPSGEILICNNLDRISEGMSGESYKGRLSNGNDCFLKVLAFPRSDYVLARFLFEMAQLKKITYSFEIRKSAPELVGVGCIAEKGIIYYATEWIKGVLLKNYFDCIDTMETEDKIKIFHRILYGVQGSFYGNEIHRDLHPGNIIINPDFIVDWQGVNTIPGDYFGSGREGLPRDVGVYVLDFGEVYCGLNRGYVDYFDDEILGFLSFSSTDKEKLNNVFYEREMKAIPGAFTCMAPEVFTESDTHDYRNYDSWAIGLIMYRVFTGEYLLSYKTLHEYIDSVINNPSLFYSAIKEKASALGGIDEGGFVRDIFIRLMNPKAGFRMPITDAKYIYYEVMIRQRGKEFKCETCRGKFLKNPISFDDKKYGRQEPECY